MAGCMESSSFLSSRLDCTEERRREVEKIFLYGSNEKKKEQRHECGAMLQASDVVRRREKRKKNRKKFQPGNETSQVFQIIHDDKKTSLDWTGDKRVLTFLSTALVTKNTRRKGERET